jgi:hypothetical protein
MERTMSKYTEKYWNNPTFRANEIGRNKEYMARVQQDPLRRAKRNKRYREYWRRKHPLSGLKYKKHRHKKLGDFNKSKLVKLQEKVMKMDYSLELYHRTHPDAMHNKLTGSKLRKELVVMENNNG